MPIEFRPDGEPILIDDTYREVKCSRRVGRRLFSNNRHAVEIVVGKKRERWLAEYEREQQLKAKPVTTISVQPLRETVEPQKMAVAVTVPIQKQVARPIDEQAEAKEFIEAVTPFIPNPNEWLWAEVHRWNVDKQLLIVVLSNGETVSCIPKLIVDSPGAHKACLAPKTTGSVRVELVRGKYRCLEAIFEGETASEEIGQIVKWDTDHRRGWATRPCGDWLYIVDDSPGHGRFENTEEYVVGEADWISFQLVRSEKNDRFIGVKVRKIEAPRGQGVSDGI
jgi:hypothetical protein